MIKKCIKISICFLVAGGIGLLLYPFISQWIYDYNASKAIKSFEMKIEQRQRKEMGVDLTAENGMNPIKKNEKIVYLIDLYNQMQEYNTSLFKNGQDGFSDAWSYQTESFDLTQWGFEDNIIGTIEIPKMEIKLPLYLGANNENMKKGAVHLTETSLPIGGENTNCVIAAHRGYSSALMFRDIEELQLEDEVYLSNPWEILTYRVVEIKIIRPNEIGEVLIQPDRDLITLITCHPYRFNYQRYVVYCEKVNE